MVGIVVVINAISNIIDKFILSNKLQNISVIVMIESILGMAVSGIIAFFHPIQSIPLPIILISIVSGILFTLGVYIYFKAVEGEEVSRVIPYFELSPIVILIASILFLKQTFSFSQLLGIVLVVGGAILLSIQFPFRFRWNNGVKFALVYVIFISWSGIISNFLFSVTNLTTIYFYGRIGSLLAVLPLLPKNFREFKAVIGQPKKYGTPIILISEFIAIAALFLIIKSIELSNATLTATIASLQPLATLVLATIIGIFYPKILKENMQTGNLIQKAVSILLICAGAILIA